MYRQWFGAFLLCGVCCVDTLRAADQTPSLSWTPRSDWVNVRDLGAKGDGAADDAAAIQKAFDQVESGATIYLPAGVYRLTQTVKLVGPATGVLIVGHGRDTTLVWEGAKGGTMLSVDGLAYTRYVGFTLDGQNVAAVGMIHDQNKRFETEVVHRHLTFRNCTDTGMLAKKEDRYALSEPTFENCLFENCGRGAAALSFNDYNWTFDGCEFRRCGIGVECVHGSMYVRNCRFEQSQKVDLAIHGEHASSVRRCVSVGSEQFIDFAYPVSPLSIQDCCVSGWKSRKGAIQLHGAPVLMFDCTFLDPPDAAPPVWVRQPNQAVLLSENTTAGGGPLVRDAEKLARLYHIPAGQRQGQMRTAERRFLRDSAPTPGKVFDAVRDFGAKRQPKEDDSAAIQACIDAARAHGQGAIAYLPSGRYHLQQTLRVSGKDYYVGGSGIQTQLVWNGAEDGIILAVEHPQDVTLENFSAGHHNSGKSNHAIDILQTSNSQPSRVTYDGVLVHGMYQKQPWKQGLHLRGLGAQDLVHLEWVQGNLRIEECSQATILATTSFEGSIIVSGKEAERDGFLGFLTRLSTVTQFGLALHDNQNIVMSDFYIEQADNGLVFQGAADLPRGRATIQGAKLSFNTPKGEAPAGTAFKLDDYAGQIFFGLDQFYVHPPKVRVQQAGANLVELFLFGNAFYRTQLQMEATDALQLRLLGNATIGEVTPDGVASYLDANDLAAEAALENLPHALDDLRRLGEVDLQVNHP